jgi:hypothetical protein
MTWMPLLPSIVNRGMTSELKKGSMGDMKEFSPITNVPKGDKLTIFYKGDKLLI